MRADEGELPGKRRPKDPRAPDSGHPRVEGPRHGTRSLDDVFQARNKISHDMDLQKLGTDALAREHRKPEVVAEQCKRVFEVGVRLIQGAAVTCKKSV